MAGGLSTPGRPLRGQGEGVAGPHQEAPLCGVILARSLETSPRAGCPRLAPPSLGRPGGQDAVITESTQGRREDDESTPETALRKPRCRADVGDHACDWAVAMVTGAPCLVSKYP